jgi:hypothetical protein
VLGCLYDTDENAPCGTTSYLASTDASVASGGQIMDSALSSGGMRGQGDQKDAGNDTVVWLSHESDRGLLRHGSHLRYMHTEA